MRRDYREFTRLFSELTLTRGIKNRDMAKILDCAPSYVTSLRNGDSGPSYQKVDRLVRHFRLDRAEWFAAAQIVDYEAVPPLREEAEIPDTPPIGGRLTPADTEEISPTMVWRALGAMGRAQAAEDFRKGLLLLEAQFGNNIVLKPGEVPRADATPEDVQTVLATIAARMQKARDDRRGKGGTAKGLKPAAAAAMATLVPLAVEVGPLVNG